MDIISLLITIAGILIILGLYILGRLSKSKMPKEKEVASVPRIIDDNGDHFTSVLDDIPATDGSTPKAVPVNKMDTTADTSRTRGGTDATKKPVPPKLAKDTMAGSKVSSAKNNTKNDKVLI